MGGEGQGVEGVEGEYVCTADNGVSTDRVKVKLTEHVENIVPPQPVTSQNTLSSGKTVTYLHFPLVCPLDIYPNHTFSKCVSDA